MNLKSIIITSFAFISIVSCKPDTKDFEKKMANDYQKQQDAVNQIEKDISTFKEEALVEFAVLSNDFSIFKKTEKCEIYKEEGKAFLERATQIEENIIKKANEKNPSISYRISSLLDQLKNNFFNTYYEILRIRGTLEDCEKEKGKHLSFKKIIGNTYS